MLFSRLLKTASKMQKNRCPQLSKKCVQIGAKTSALPQENWLKIGTFAIPQKGAKLYGKYRRNK
jgi:hypothetical protein